MSFLSDALGFEKFHTKDLWDRLRKDPKRLVLGVDPASTKVWNKILGRDDEPLVDQMGGAYGGHMFSAFGNKDGGVYERARKAGIDTKAGGQMQDLAHVIAAFYALGGGQGLGALGGGGAGAGAAGGGSTAPFGFGPGMSLETTMPSIAGATPGINPMAGGLGAGASAAPSLSFGPQQAMGLAALAQPPAQQPAPPPPVQQPRREAKPMANLTDRLGSTLFPVDPEAGLSPEQQRAMQGQALLRMGLGMMAASGQGRGLGESLWEGYGSAQQGLGGQTERAYSRRMAREARDYTRTRDATEDTRFAQTLERDKARDQETAEYRKSSLENQRAELAARTRAENLTRQIQLGEMRMKLAREQRLQELLQKPVKTANDWAEIQALQGGSLPGDLMGGGLGGLVPGLAGGGVTPEMLLNDPDL